MSLLLRQLIVSAGSDTKGCFFPCCARIGLLCNSPPPLPVYILNASINQASGRLIDISIRSLTFGVCAEHVSSGSLDDPYFFFSDESG